MLHQFLVDSQIDHVYTNVHSVNKTSVPERAIRYLRQTTGRILASGKLKGPAAIRAAVSTYNKTPSKLLDGLSPSDVNEDNLGRLENFLFKRKQTLISHVKSDPLYKLGDIVHRVIDRSVFAKSSYPRVTKATFEIVQVKPTLPTPSYKLQNTETLVVLPGTFNFSQIVSAS